MNYSTLFTNLKPLGKMLSAVVLITIANSGMAQNCPSNTPATISTNPNTYYPGLDNSLNAGATSITIGAAGSGTIPVSTGDLLLVIQMQGAQIHSSNSTDYGDGITGGRSNGYLNNTDLLAGNMEYVVATNNVALGGGTLTLLNPTTKSYRTTSFGTDGQYSFQVIRVGLFHSLTLGATIAAPAWNGTTGGVVAISVTNDLNFNGQTITAAGAGFRGGGARRLSGGAGGLNTDLVTLSTNNFNASKGEGIAGTPRFLNNNGVLLDNGAANEGYPGGSYAAGAPGNAGGGGTDGRPSNNDQNSGGGGGANGGIGGKGGNSWNSNLPTGGERGAAFSEVDASRMVMGGGGGAGTTNDGTGTPASGFASSGAAGGGIVLVSAGTITGTGYINVSGASGNTTVLNDATGGGGAGGSVLIFAGTGHAGISINAAGGIGGSNSGGSNPPEHGPGGGGGGGVIYSNAAVNGSSSIAPGASGHSTANSPFSAEAGSAGILVENVTISQVPPQYLSCIILAMRKATIKKQQDELSALSLAVLPNPATGGKASIRFNMKKNTTAPVQLRMLSVNGISVWQQTVSASEGINMVPVENLSSIPNGVYFLQYFNGLDRMNVKMVVKH